MVIVGENNCIFLIFLFSTKHLGSKSHKWLEKCHCKNSTALNFYKFYNSYFLPIIVMNSTIKRNAYRFIYPIAERNKTHPNPCDFKKDLTNIFCHISLLSLAQRPQFELGAHLPYNSAIRKIHARDYFADPTPNTYRSSIRLFVLGTRRCPFL